MSKTADQDRNSLTSEDDISLHELQPRPGRPSADSLHSSDFGHLLSDDGSSASSTDLPPIDSGLGAWTFLFGTWLLEATVWAFALSFGVFQDYYSKHELFRESDLIPTIGAVATGVTYLGMPVTNPIAMRWPQHRRKMIVVGYVMCLVGLVAASFARQAWQLLLFQGFVFAFGWVVCYTPFLFMLNEWFVEKRGLAYGILFCASGLSGLFIPLGVGASLERFGFRYTLRGYTVLTIVLSGPALFLMRPRISHSNRGDSLTQTKGLGIGSLWEYCKTIHLPLFATAVFLQGLAFFLPNIFITSYAKDLGLSSTESSGLLALISFAQVLGQLWQGWISDRVNVYIPASISTIIPGLAAALLWGPARGMAYLAPFALIWGFFSASYSVLYTRMCTFVIDSAKDKDTGEGLFMMLYSVLSFLRGVSNILEGPLSSWLFGDELDVERFGLARYAEIVWFTAIGMLASSLAGLGMLWRRRSM
ncbi:hypothetical protein PRZ48_013701 [Zasmidium cellare]|uniref:MFS general substrate transporter n=1 Tax=Zasmidium cellare TaxID=395010 RepID=A0ABR0E264_ZASCE|nr:hypothetical protein PRZ48_013701 [Zasmidium cellare]